MASRSADVAGERPFYDRHADTYDALHTAGACIGTVLDAGCGTGRHAAALVVRGHEVTLLDASVALLRIARSGTWRTTSADLPDGSHLRFVSRPTWDDGRIVVEERYELFDGRSEAP